MNSVGIDISKGRSTIAVMRPFGEVVISPFEVRHTDSELSELARQLKSLDGETRVVMEATGNYHAPVAKLLHDAGLYVSVVNAKLVHGYGNNDLRRVKTDKKDAVKLANYGLDRWLTLPRYIPEEDTRLLLKNCCRQYRQYSNVQTVLKNNLISLLDTAFPNANRLFSSPIRGDGSEKWVDFVAEFWHCRCVSEKSQKAFTNKYQRWCRKHGYNFSEATAHTIYAEASGHIGVMPKSETTKAARGTSCIPAQSDFCRACCTQTRNANIGFPAAGMSRCHGSVRRRPDSGAAAHSRNWRCAPVLLKESIGGLRWTGCSSK